MQDNIVEGFILSRKQVEYQDKTFLEYWLSTPNGALKVRTPAESFVLFVSTREFCHFATDFLKQHKQCEVRHLSLKLFNQDACSAIYSPTQAAFFTVKDWLKQNNVVSYEDDIRLSDRYLMERFVYGSAAVASGKSTEQGIEDVRLKASQYTPQFSPLSLDIECSEKGELYSIGMASAEASCVLMIGSSEADAPAWLHWVNDERELLLRFITEFNSLDPDIIIGWSVISFDFRLLLKRAERYGIALTIGRDGSAMTWREARSGSQPGFLNLAGRVVQIGRAHV